MLVGRETEAEQVARAVRGRQVVAVSGPPGIGKTALIRHLRDDLDEVYLGHAVPSLQHRSYQPLLHAFGLPPVPDEAPAMTRRVRDHLGSHGVLMLEDLQWADPGTLEVLVGLAGHCGVVVTVQPGFQSGPMVCQLVSALGGVVVPLLPLPELAMVELIAQARPGLVAGEQRRLAQRAAGVPLIAEILARVEDADRLDDGSLIDVVVARLSPAGRTALATLGAAAVPLPEDAVDGVGELLAAQLAHRQPDQMVVPYHWAFAEAALAAQEPQATRTIHRRLAALVQLPAAQRAAHLFEAGDFREAATMALRAAEGPVPRGEQAADLRLAARAAMRAEQDVRGPAEFVDVDDLRIRAAAALNDTAAYAEAVDLIGMLSTFSPHRRVGAAIEAFRGVLGHRDWATVGELLADSAELVDQAMGPEGARARSLRAWLERAAGTDRSVRRLAEEHLVAATDGGERARAAMVMGLATVMSDPDEAMRLLRIAREEGEREGDLVADLEASRNLVMVQISLGYHEEGRALARQCAERAIAAGAERWAIEFRTLDVVSHAYENTDRGDARSWLSYVRSSPVRLETRALATVSLAITLADQGSIRRSWAVLEEWVRPDALAGFDPLTSAMVLWAATQRAWIMRDLAETVRWAQVATDLVPAGYPTLAGTHVMWRWAEYEMGLALTAPDPKGGLLDSAQREADAITVLHAGDARAAAEQFLAAAESWQRILWRSTLRCRWAAGHALALAGDRQAAITLLEATDRSLDSSGATALRSRVQASLRLAASPAGVGARRAGAGGAITNREREILRLVADGLRTAEIASRLGIADATVNSHIRTATRKLGVRTRAEAAAKVRPER